jgi:hypothetical protein
MSPKSYALTIAALEKAVVDFSRPEKIRRSCALRLARLRAAGRPATGLRPTPGTTTTTRTKPAPAAKPATPPVPTERARYEAVQSFLALSRSRTALHRKRRTPAETEIYFSMTALMPAAVPVGDDAKSWTDFIARISGILEEIKSTN